jgi:hypothetical protein
MATEGSLLIAGFVDVEAEGGASVTGGSKPASELLFCVLIIFLCPPV